MKIALHFMLETEIKDTTETVLSFQVALKLKQLVIIELIQM